MYSMYKECESTLGLRKTERECFFSSARRASPAAGHQPGQWGKWKLADTSGWQCSESVTPEASRWRAAALLCYSSSQCSSHPPIPDPRFCALKSASRRSSLLLDEKATLGPHFKGGRSDVVNINSLSAPSSERAEYSCAQARESFGAGRQLCFSTRSIAPQRKGPLCKDNDKTIYISTYMSTYLPTSTLCGE